MSRAIIVGGGISGLALAYRLQSDPTLEIQVLEQRNRVGGTIETVQREGFVVEAGPNGFLDTQPATRELCMELGIGDQLIPASESAGRNRFLFLDSKLHRLPSGLLSFLTSGALSWRGKWNLLMEGFRRNQPAEEEESIHAFATRRAGAEIADTLADAFVTGIVAGDPKKLSMQATFPRLANLEREHGSLMRGMKQARKQKRAEAKEQGLTPTRARMWSFRAGLNLLVETIRQKLRQSPILGVTITGIHPQNEGQPGPRWVVAGENQRWEADAVILACPAYAQATIVQPLDAQLAEHIQGIPYNRVAVVALGYQRQDISHPLDGFGYLTPQREGRDVLGVQWCSSIFPDRAPSDKVLLRAMCGGWNRPEILDWDDEQLTQAVRRELQGALAINKDPVFHHIVRWERAIPQYHVGHQQRLARIEERRQHFPGLFLAGNSYRGVALNDCVEQAGVIANQVTTFFRT